MGCFPDTEFEPKGMVIEMTVIFACLLAFVLSLALTFPIRKVIAPRFGFMDVPKDPRHIHKKATPLLGGLGIYIAFAVAAAVFGHLETTLPYIIGGGIVVLCGVLDDRFSLSPKIKLLFQLAAGIVLCVFGVTVQHICFFGYHIQMGIFQYPMTVLWVAAVSNAFNLIDGLDGLCTSITVVASGGVGLIALTNGYDGVFVCAMILMCSALGFLPHNVNPAKIFLGDTGSLFFGFIMSAMCIDVVYVENTHVPTMVAIILIGLPVFDTTYAIVRRLYNHQGIMTGDKNHTHHILMRRYSHVKAVVLMSLASILCVGIALFTTGGGIFEAVGYLLTVIVIALAVYRLAIVKKGHRDSEKKPDDAVNPPNN